MRTASHIYYNGTIQTMNPEATCTEALAIQGDRVLGTGSSQEMLALASESTIRTDLQGKVIYPGFIDGHSHFVYSGKFRCFGIDLNSYPIGNIGSIADVLDKLSQTAAASPEGQWIMGYGFDDSAVKEMRMLLADDLDAVSVRHPIFIRHISGHLAFCNTLAMELANITPDTRDPDGGVIVRDKAGNPTGVFEEPNAYLMVMNCIPEPSSDDWVRAIAFASQWYAAKGITTAQDGGMYEGCYEHVVQALKEKALKIRLHLLPRIGKCSTSALPTLMPGKQITQDCMISMGAMKLFVDGSIQGYTGFLSQPYHRQLDSSRDRLAWCGYPVLQEEKLNELVCTYHRQGCQVAIHANGDAAIEMALNAFELAQKKYPRPDPRHIIIHCQMVREDQLERISSLGIIPSFFILHVYYWGDRHNAIFLGPDRSSRLNPLKSAKTRNIIYTTHSDDFVTPIDPLFGVWAAVNRKTSSGKVLGRDHVVPALDAMRSITSWAALQNNEEDIKGTLEPGKLADLVVLDADPLSVPPESIKDISILATLVANKLVFGSLDAVKTERRGSIPQ